MSGVTVDVAVDGSLVRIACRGEVDLANVADVEDGIFSAITNLVTAVSVDLTDVVYIDSAGLQVLFGLAARLRVLQTDLEVVAPVGSPARRAVELSGLGSLVPLRPS